MDEKHTLTGNIQQHPGFESRILRNRRDVLVYLPQGYARARRCRYPVLYLHDGQNVFDAATSFAGVEWGVDETAQILARKRLIAPLISQPSLAHGGVAASGIGDVTTSVFIPPAHLRRWCGFGETPFGCK